MKKICAIFWLTIKSAIRSRLFAGSATALFVIMVGLPFLVKGDGTPVGDARVLIYYNLGIAAALVGMLALIEACGAVSQEISERQIQLVRSKPVSSMHIWIGKWFGILCISGVLILLAGVTTRISFSIRGFRGQQLEEEVLTARRRIAPREERIELAVDHRYDALVQAGVIDPNADEQSVKEQLKVIIVAARTTVGAGKKKRWLLKIPGGCRPDSSKGEDAVKLRSFFNSGYRDERPMRCSWRVLSKEGEELFAVPSKEYYEGINMISLPTELVKHDQLIIEFINDETETGRTIVFNSKRGMEILVSEGGFEMNMVRALLVVFMTTALLAALGLTLGAAFSFPVAVFASTAIVFASFIAHFFMTTEFMPHSHQGCSHSCHSRVDTTLGENMAAAFEKVVGPVLDLKPAEFLSQGLLVSWEEVGRTVLIVFACYPFILFLIGAFSLSRRQLALPEGF